MPQPHFTLTITASAVAKLIATFLYERAPVEKIADFTYTEPVPEGCRRVQFTHLGKEYTVDAPANLSNDEARALIKEHLSKWFGTPKPK